MARPYFFSLLLFLLLYGSSVQAGKVGIFGCPHGDKDILKNVLSEMKNLGVTSVIGNGDFVHFGNLQHLEEMVGLIPEMTSLPKENVFLMPGNWEHETGMKASQANDILKKYGEIITEEYYGSGVVKIDGKTIKVAHFPQQPIPGYFLAPSKFSTVYFYGQAHLLLTMLKKEKMEGADLKVFGHTHIRADFYDQESGKLIINAGGLDRKRKKEDEIMSFAIYDTDQATVQFYAAETGKPLGNAIPVIKPEESQEMSYDTNDYGICKVGFDDPMKLDIFIEKYGHHYK